MPKRHAYRIDYLPINDEEDAAAFFDVVEQRTPQGRWPMITVCHEEAGNARTVDYLKQ